MNWARECAWEPGELDLSFEIGRDLLAARGWLEQGGLRQSMSARANPYDNAWTESFIGTLKREMLQGGCFADATDARLELFEYIEAYYNNHRKHSAIGYLTPNQFETQIQTNQSSFN